MDDVLCSLEQDLSYRYNKKKQYFVQSLNKFT